jgi:thiamine transport system permease protein
VAGGHEQVIGPANQPGSLPRIGGWIVLALLAGVVGAAVFGLLASADSPVGSSGVDAYTRRIIGFTILQAGLSTVLSVGAAIPLARALARRTNFPGRTWLLRFMALPLGLPPIVAALGLIAFWGQQGLMNRLLTGTGIAEPISIYGLSGILLAHVFFNMPMAARLMVAELERLPVEYWRNAAQFGLPSRRIFMLIEAPALLRVVPGIASLVFMLCATSFTLVLLLGGGPAATTIEVAIYQALRFDYDPPRAVTLAFIQIGLTSLLLLALRLLPHAEEGTGGGAAIRRFEGSDATSRLADALVIGAGATFLLMPFWGVIAAGLTPDLMSLLSDPRTWQALLTSLLVAGTAAVVSLLLASLAIAARHRAIQRFSRADRVLTASLGGATSLILLVPPVVLGAGWFVLLGRTVDVFRIAPLIVIAVNALMALPFVMRVLEPAYRTHMLRTDRLALSLGISGLSRLGRIDLPALAPAILAALSFAMALSLGDLGAIALFGSQDFVTLPALLYQRMGSYRTAEAAGLALILATLCLALMTVGTRATAHPRSAP